MRARIELGSLLETDLLHREVSSGRVAFPSIFLAASPVVWSILNLSGGSRQEPERATSAGGLLSHQDRTGKSRGSYIGMSLTPKILVPSSRFPWYSPVYDLPIATHGRNQLLPALINRVETHDYDPPRYQPHIRLTSDLTIRIIHRFVAAAAAVDVGDELIESLPIEEIQRHLRAEE